MEMLVDVRGRQNRFWMGRGYRLAPRQCSSRQVVQEEPSQAEPVPAQAQTVQIRRSGSKKKRARFRALFQVLRREKQVERANYMPNVRPDALAFRKATNARPSKPVPSSNRLGGSGAGAR
jgi:hypothetical protein